jgi:hypothetical protein
VGTLVRFPMATDFPVCSLESHTWSERTVRWGASGKYSHRLASSWAVAEDDPSFGRLTDSRFSSCEAVLASTVGSWRLDRVIAQGPV